MFLTKRKDRAGLTVSAPVFFLFYFFRVAKKYRTKTLFYASRQKKKEVACYVLS